MTDDDPVLSEMVRNELTHLQRVHGRASLLILSGLAEGADRLVVKVARDVPGARFWAILPLPDALFERDFDGAASLADYKALKRQAQRVIEAPFMASRHRIADAGEPRNHQYAWIGAFVAERAQVLLAIWDGAPARGTGGTAHLIDWFLAGETPPIYRISAAPRIPARAGVARTLLHINPITHTIRRTVSRRSSPARW